MESYEQRVPSNTWVASSWFALLFLPHDDVADLLVKVKVEVVCGGRHSLSQPWDWMWVLIQTVVYVYVPSTYDPQPTFVGFLISTCITRVVEYM